ncbi:MAG: amidohydrolase, partial [Lachnospiraceae bacterium]|nr:amidohydrolase [Lachnospiraceae bacterium]
GLAEKKQIHAGAPGHGCGHNMLGTASLASAIGVKKYLEETGKSGTVVYLGCPGEEGGSGKAFMAKEGAFSDLDAAITWHPGDLTRTCTSSSLANYQVAYKFYGTSAHAGGAPHLGRSALDALELMNMGVQFLREHVIPEARIHYAITNTGGYSPNVVQPYAEVLYLIRAPKNRQVEEIYQRVNRIAEGAAHMTETRVEIDFVKGCSNLISNKVIAKKLWENLNELGAPEYTEEELAFAKKIHESVGDSCYESLEKQANIFKRDVKKDIMAHKGEAMYQFVLPYDDNGVMSFGSTDVGDVSWNCPTAQAYVATWAAGTPGHSWQIVSQGKSGLAHKGLIYAAKAMAGAAIDMYEDPALIDEAKLEMEETLDGDTYLCPIPDGCKPRALGMTK